MKVMLGGSRHLSVLPEEVIDCLNTWARDGYEFLAGDAKGTDAKFQEYFKHLNYRLVQVYFSGEYARHNFGNWDTIRIDSGLKSKGHALHGAKDREMAKRADVGLMIWDTLSVGTIANLLDLVTQGKTCFMYVFSEDMNLYSMENSSDLEIWKARYPDVFDQASKRLESHEKRVDRSKKRGFETLF